MRKWIVAVVGLGLSVTPTAVTTAAENVPSPIFNRAPLVDKPYSELPLGAIEPQGWLRDEMRRMAAGMTGHLDDWYPEVCGPRNRWLGGDGDCWERGPYWIDGLYPLAKLLKDKQLEAKAMQWIEWTLANQRPSGQIGPSEIDPKDRKVPPPPGAQIGKAEDWWPRMVMLKILMQHYQATGDGRVLDCLDKYFRYQLAELPRRPLHDEDNPAAGTTYWAAQRGGDNLLVILWLYNITGEKYLLELAEIIHKQTVPVTDWFSPGEQNAIRVRDDQAKSLHCVNLAQMMKTPIVRWQQDQDERHLKATENAFKDIRTFHGQPNGLYGGDEHMHGDDPNRGSELCTAVEMMYSLEKMFEITGDPAHADRLERVAFNALPTQTTHDYHGRQYFQQTNQVTVTFGDRDFFNDNGDRVVYGLLRGYPCCTCNLHQGWPKFAQHAWLASRDGGVAVVTYVPSKASAQVSGGQTVSLTMETDYPFKEGSTITVSTTQPVEFPLHVRIPSWAENSQVSVNGETSSGVKPGTMHILRRQWKDGDKVTLRFPMKLRTSTWFARSRAIERGPLVYALDIETAWSDKVEPRPAGVPASAMHRGYREARPKTPWNYALTSTVLNNLEKNVQVEEAAEIAVNPWTRDAAPVKLKTKGVRLPYWSMNREQAALPPLSPVERPKDATEEQITLIPYGSTTLRIAEFPMVQDDKKEARP